MTDLMTMDNIGPVMDEKLKSVDIHSAEELIQIGSKEAFLRLKARYPNVCLVHLYSLQGAIDQILYNRLPDEVKRELKEFTDRLK